MAHTPQTLDFTFPADTPHAGMPLGNGNLGVLAWADAHGFHLTLNRQDYWNRRGRIVWGAGARYPDLLQQIHSGNRQNYRPELIRTEPEGAPRPCRMPLGRLTLPSGQASSLPGRAGRLDTAAGVAWLDGAAPVVVDPAEPLLFVGGVDAVALLPEPARGAEVEAYWRQHAIPAPRAFAAGGARGWTQSGVDRRTICVAVASCPGGAAACVVYGESHDTAVAAALERLQAAGSVAAALQRAAAFQRAWWERVPPVRLDAPHLQRLWDYAMFKVSGMCRPGSPPPTLQGPWVEDDALAPWQSDYHFNINYQMAHWPLLPGGHPEQYEPMLRQMRDWLPLMREYARVFAGVDDGVMLPHAANDEGRLANESWKHQFDAGSAAWNALMLWDYVRATGDRAALEQVAWPMLRGALRVYQALVEQTPGQSSFFAPSPEYVTPDQVWFENPSFHLAFIHKLCAVLPQAAAALGIQDPALPGLLRLARILPRASVVNGEIAIGKGIPLTESHRHHSHLAGVFPCEIFDGAGADTTLVDHTFWRWSKLGMGEWVGWSLPWAARLWTRLNEPAAADLCLELAARFFTHPNFFGSHNAFHKGFGGWYTLRPPYIMQLDITAGFAAAVLDARDLAAPL